MTTLTTATRTALADAAVDRIDAGGGAGKIEWRDAADVLIATTTLDATAFGAAVAGVATMAGAPKTSALAVAAGTVTKALFKDFGGTEHWRATVGLSLSDINLTAVLYAIGDTIRLDAYTYTQPA